MDYGPEHLPTTLIVPGLGGSGADHWQSWLQQRIPDAVRVSQHDNATPDLPRWAAEVDAALDAIRGPVVIVAHSFGCLATVTGAHHHAKRITGVLLAAPADPEKFGISSQIPAHALGYPAIVAASRNDPWVTFDTARTWAAHWQARLVDAGFCGHINAQAGFGPWLKGFALWESLIPATRFATTSGLAGKHHPNQSDKEIRS